MLRMVLPLLAALLALGPRLPAQNPIEECATFTTARAATMQVQTNLNQLMRGVLYPASNLVFSTQTDNPREVKFVPGKDPSLATDPLVSTFGGWQAVENAALALTESANLLLIPWRSCSKGVPVPMNNPGWSRFVQDLRDAGLKAYMVTSGTRYFHRSAAGAVNSAALACCWHR